MLIILPGVVFVFRRHHLPFSVLLGVFGDVAVEFAAACGAYCSSTVALVEHSLSTWWSTVSSNVHVSVVHCQSSTQHSRQWGGVPMLTERCRGGACVLSVACAAQAMITPEASGLVLPGPSDEPLPLFLCDLFDTYLSLYAH